jgi:hypothetical protein
VPAGLRIDTWRRREIENYISQPATLLAWAVAEGVRTTGGPLFASGWRNAMEQAIQEVESALGTLGKLDRPDDIKASDEYLEPVFAAFFRRLELPNLMNKSDYHQLAGFVPLDGIDPEVIAALDAIADAAAAALPRNE